MSFSPHRCATGRSTGGNHDLTLFYHEAHDPWQAADQWPAPFFDGIESVSCEFRAGRLDHGAYMHDS